jgi:MYXO-CTERM domain-containing protein
MDIKGIAIAVALSMPVAANAALSSVAGGLGVYDSVNNVTWTADANLFATQAASYSGGSAAFISAVIAASGGVVYDTPNNLDNPPFSGTHILSANDFYALRMNWYGAQAWVHYLNVTDFAGSNQWALPTTVDSPSSNASPPSQSSSQMAQLFYGGLGQVAGSSITTTHNSSFNLFKHMQSAGYVSGTEVSGDPLHESAWSFDTSTGSQNAVVQTKLFGSYYALAVSPGQVSGANTSVSSTDGPLPWWAIGALGAGLIGVARRRLKATY